MERYRVVKEYYKGDYFGELALLYSQNRAASINAARTSFFVTIHKDDYEAYVKRFEKREKDNMVDFFKQVHFMSNLSS